MSLHNIFSQDASWKDVEALAKTDAIACRAVEMVHRGHCTQLQAMISVVLWLTQDRDALLKEKTEAWMRQPSSMEIMLKPSPGDGKQWVVDSLSPFSAHIEDVR